MTTTGNCADYFEVDDISANTPSVTGSIRIPVGVWYHVAFVYSYKTGNIYVNGTLSASSSSFFESKTVIGMRTDNNFGYSDIYTNNGDVSLDEIKLYNRALSQAQVQKDMNTMGVPAPSDMC
jgi:hypothetical protein